MLLKTLGLCALMARCGLTLPVDEGSKLPLYRAIFTDIGDEQSIERDLSTFSGHLTNINTFIELADPTSLVLLDELFTGTDPMQGAALAAALLDELSAQGASTVVTTHLESLKTLAFSKDSYANASMGFDLEELAPTYRVIYGLPGSSYAVRIAERLGFPERIVDRARQILEGEEYQSVEEILSSLEDRRDEMEAEQRRLEHARREAEDAKQKYQRRYDKLLAKEKEMVHEQTRELKQELDAARQLIRDRIAELQKAGGVTTRELNQQDLEQVREGLGELEGDIERAADYARPPEPGPSGLARVQPEDLEEGMEVYAHTFKRQGEVLEYSEGDSEAQVQLGAMKVKISIEDLFYPNERSRRKKTRGASSSSGSELAHAASSRAAAGAATVSPGCCRRPRTTPWICAGCAWTRPSRRSSCSWTRCTRPTSAAPTSSTATAAARSSAPCAAGCPRRTTSRSSAAASAARAVTA